MTQPEVLDIGCLTFLSNFRGKHVVLEFWGSWCGPCVDTLPELKSLQNEFGKEVEVVGFLGDNLDDAKKAIKEHKITWRNWIETNEDGPIHTKWNINSWPTTFLIGPDGKIIARDISIPEIHHLLINLLDRK